MRPALLTPQIRKRAQSSEVAEPGPHSPLVMEQDRGPVRFGRASADPHPLPGARKCCRDVRTRSPVLRPCC